MIGNLTIHGKSPTEKEIGEFYEIQKIIKELDWEDRKQCHRRSIELEGEVDQSLKVGISYFAFLLMMARLAIIELRFFRYVEGILYQDKGDR